MRPLTLSVRGYAAFVRPLTLDVSGLAGIVAVTGKTGGGKTSLIDALAGCVPLWREFSTRAESVQRYCTGRDARVELTFGYQGETYRSLLLVDPEANGGAGKQEAYLFGPGCADTKGRTTDYKLLVEGREAKAGEPASPGKFPPRSVFLAAAFSAQDRGGNFFALTVPERKELFAALIGLAALQARAARAGAARARLDAILAEFEREMARLLLDSTSARALREAAVTLEGGIPELVTLEAAALAAVEAAVAESATVISAYDQLIIARRAAIDRARSLDDQVAAAFREAGDLSDQLGALDQIMDQEETIRDRARALQAANTDRAGALVEYTAARSILRSAEETAGRLTRDRDRVLGEIERAEAVIRSSDRVADRVRDLVAKSVPLPKMTADLVALAAEVSAEDGRLGPLRTNSRNEAGAADLRLAAARRDLEAARKAAGLLDGVPCGGDVLYTETDYTTPQRCDGAPVDCGTCWFLTNARTAAARIPDLEAAMPRLEVDAADALQALADVQEADRRLTERRAARDRLQREREALMLVEVDLARARSQLTAREAAQASLRELVERRDGLDLEVASAAQAVTEAAEALAAIEARGVAADARRKAHAGADDSLRELEAAAARRPLLVANLEAAQARRARASAERDQVVIPPEPTTWASAAESARERIAGLRGGHAEASRQLREHRSALDVVRGKLSQLGDVDGRREAVAAKRARAGAMRAGFVLVERAFGRDGIQALEIDAAGPEVSGIANELLTTVFGTRFTVRLRTIQEAGAGRVQREVFDLEIFDGARIGRPATFGDLSGGEQSLVGMAFRLALTVFNVRRHGGQFETLWMDEADFGLDPELVDAYPAMLRRARELGGFHSVYYISHNTTAWEQADHVIRVEDGAAWIER